MQLAITAPALHREPLVHLQALRLCPAGAAIHLDARRVDHGVFDALADAKTVQPNPIAASFVATHHAGLLG
jgi:hypothetical protein